MQPGPADPVGPVFVFLQLLESQAELLADRFLGHAQQDAPKPDLSADGLIDRVELIVGELANGAGRRDNFGWTNHG